MNDKCPKCKGSGELPSPIHTRVWNEHYQRYEPRVVTGFKTCDRCHGDGVTKKKK